jgi:hypothetical protein
VLAGAKILRFSCEDTLKAVRIVFDNEFKNQDHHVLLSVRGRATADKMSIDWSYTLRLR